MHTDGTVSIEDGHAIIEKTAKGEAFLYHQCGCVGNYG